MTDRDEIIKLVKTELDEANKIHPPFNSAHEGYAVILEEFEEMMEEINRASDNIKVMWNNIKIDGECGTAVAKSRAYDRMLDAIAEAIQVCAMLKKMDTIKGE